MRMLQSDILVPLFGSFIFLGFSARLRGRVTVGLRGRVTVTVTGRLTVTVRLRVWVRVGVTR